MMKLAGHFKWADLGIGEHKIHTLIVSCHHVDDEMKLFCPIRINDMSVNDLKMIRDTGSFNPHA